jgi:hypothetical protein
MASTEDIRRDFNAASTAIRKGLNTTNGGGAAESRYSGAYQRLVETGEASETGATIVPLRPKYRR